MGIVCLSINKGKPAAIIGIVRQFIFYVPVRIVLLRFVGISGIYYGSFAIDLVIVLWTMFMVNKEFRLLNKCALK